MRPQSLSLPASLGNTSLYYVLLFFLIKCTLADNKSQPVSIFRSRPDLETPIVTVFLQEKELQAPGYYFISPYQQIQESVHIYDNDGNLVWTGFGGVGPGISHAPQVCNYKGEVHLCFYQGTQMRGWGHGHGLIMNKHYQVVKSIEPGSYQASSDMHEFIMLPDGKSAVMTQYLRSVHNLCDFKICNGLGYIQQGAFQEVEVETGKVLFEWRSLDHIDVNESYVGPGTTEISGNGKSPNSPWDYFHINSIDKNKDGDYLISARHVSAIYKISGKDGHVIWRLNGARSDYYLEDFNFSFQHDARWVSETDDETIMTIFDNGSNGFNQTQPWSTGIKISMNHKTKVAKLLKKYDPPEHDGGRRVSKSQGNYQTLKNDNVLLGWGSEAFWTEYTENGTVAFYGAIGFINVMNYRTHKFENWVGLPLTKPALWTYSKTGEDNMVFYVSWNGATEVAQWVFHTADSKSGPWMKAAEIPKSGFESICHSDRASRYSYADAIDKNGKWLGSSEVQEVFIPHEKLLPYCDDLACQFVWTEEEKQRQREEEERRQREADEAKRRAAKKIKKLGSSLGGSFVLIALLIFTSTRKVVRRGLGRVGFRIAEKISSGRGRGYKALPLSEQPDGTTSALDERNGTTRL